MDARAEGESRPKRVVSLKNFLYFLLEASVTIGTRALLHSQLPRGKGVLTHCPLLLSHDGRALHAGEKGRESCPSVDCSVLRSFF